MVSFSIPISDMFTFYNLWSVTAMQDAAHYVNAYCFLIRPSALLSANAVILLAATG